MKTKNYIFLLLLAVLIILNIYLFPKLNFYINYSTYISVIIGILGAVLAANFLKNTKLAQNKSLIVLFLPIVTFFGLTLFNVFYPVDAENEILSKSGIETSAQIIDKSHLEIKRAETFEFLIKYKNQNDEIIETKISTLSDQYNQHNIGDIIKIVYSSENNQLVRVIND